MSNDLQFEDKSVNSIASKRAKFKTTHKTFAERLVSLGVAKDEDQGRLILIVLIVICFGFIVYINMKTFSSPTPINVTEDEMIGIEANI